MFLLIYTNNELQLHAKREGGEGGLKRKLIEQSYINALWPIHLKIVSVEWLRGRGGDGDGGDGEGGVGIDVDVCKLLFNKRDCSLGCCNIVLTKNDSR